MNFTLSNFKKGLDHCLRIEFDRAIIYKLKHDASRQITTWQFITNFLISIINLTRRRAKQEPTGTHTITKHLLGSCMQKLKSPSYGLHTFCCIEIISGIDEGVSSGRVDQTVLF